MPSKKEVLSVDVVVSMSDATKSYQIKTYEEGAGQISFWCTCPSFRFQKKCVEERSCKHTRALTQEAHWVLKVSKAVRPYLPVVAEQEMVAANEIIEAARSA